MIFLRKSCTHEHRTRAASSDISKAPRSSHRATSLSDPDLYLRGRLRRLPETTPPSQNIPPIAFHQMHDVRPS